MKRHLVSVAAMLLPILSFAQQAVEPPQLAAPKVKRLTTEADFLKGNKIVVPKQEALPGQFDHVATIDGYTYNIRIDRTQTPPVAWAQETEETTDRFLSTNFVLKKGFAAHHNKVKAYLYQLTGRTQPEESTPVAQEVAASWELPAPSSELRPGGGDRWDCDPFYEDAIENTWYTYNLLGNQVWIDDAGLPTISTITLRRAPTTAPRDEACERRVKKWGDPGDAPGHSIAASLGGWGGRANLNPQNGELNNGPYKKFEYSVKNCATKGLITTATVQFMPEGPGDGEYRPKYYHYDIKAIRPGAPYGAEIACTMENKATQEVETMACINAGTRDLNTYCNITCGCEL